MQTMNRRALVAGAAVLPAIAIPAAAQRVPDPVFAAIEAYRTAEATFIARVGFEDDLWEKGIELEPAADEYHRTPEMVRAVKASIAARKALAETAPTTLAGLAAVFRFVRENSENEFFFAGDKESTCFVATIDTALASLVRS